MSGRPPTLTLLVLTLLTLDATRGASGAEVRRHRGPAPLRSAVVDDDRRIDGNQLNMYFTNTGTFAFDNSSGTGGLEYPKGSGMRALFAAGLWIGAKVGGDVRVTVSQYSDEYQPGNAPGGTADDPTKPAFRVYKVVPFTGISSETTHVIQPTTGFEDTLVHHSWSEYVNGAAPYGAPTRTYRLPVTDTPDPTDSMDVVGPDVPGSQMLWSVWNDLDAGLHTNTSGSTAPLGIEVQQTAWAFGAYDGAFRNTVFLAYRIINRGTDVLDSAYVGIWSDPDLGGLDDDLLASDPPRGFGYCYNATNTDAIYGATPPAIGFDLIRGPMVQGSPLAATSFVKLVSGTDPISATESYHYLRGLDRNGDPIVDPTTTLPTTFMHSSDPVAGTGWLDTDLEDKRMLLASGPFTMGPGDMQELVVALIVAHGSDRLASVSLLRSYDEEIQRVFDVGGPTAVQVSLAEARVTAAGAHIAWHVSGADRLQMTVYRSEDGTTWEAFGTPVVEGAERVAFTDASVQVGGRYGYRLGVRDGDGETVAGDVWLDVTKVHGLALLGLVPNPASGELRASFVLADASAARLELIDLQGRRWRAREVGGSGPGRQVVSLGSSRSMPPGIYALRLTQAGRSVSVRAVVLK